ncbi:MAG: HRDC domain-containing protein [Pseudomonadota bacterium]
MTAHRYIDSNSALADAASGWGRVLAIDTEFMRTDTFFARPGLYQIASEDSILLADPVAIDDWTPLVEALEDPAVTVVMHSCSEDLELLYSHLGVQPTRLKDTQLMQAFLSPDYSLSYAALVARWREIEISKAATRSDWLKRPLTEAQRHYAAADVLYLGGIYQDMHESLERLGRSRWCDEEAAERLRFRGADPDRYYLQVKSAWRLDEESLYRLRALCAWREREAMQLDRPRNRVVRDDWLLALAKAPRLGSAQLKEQLPPGAVKRFGPALRTLHEDPLEGYAEQPLLEPEAPLSTGQNKAVQALREFARGVAEELDMAPELLARKREIESLVREYLREGELPTLAGSWRAPLLLERFRTLLAGAL